jgi:hypothetical protein
MVRSVSRAASTSKSVQLSEQLIDNVIQPALTAFDEFFPGLADVIAGIETPASAMAKAEYGKD